MVIGDVIVDVVVGIVVDVVDDVDVVKDDVTVVSHITAAFSEQSKSVFHFPLLSPNK